jgi:hypothetical protein
MKIKYYRGDKFKMYLIIMLHFLIAHVEIEVNLFYRFKKLCKYIIYEYQSTLNNRD